MRTHPEQRAIFGAAVAEVGRADDLAVLDARDFTGTRTVVDVGGGSGALLQAVLAAHPQSSGVLFDQADVVDAVRGRFAADERCRLVGGDFFRDPWPDGDLYLMKSVLHNWSDAQAAELLRNGRRAMAPGSRLLLIERVVPPGDAPHPSKDMDLFMLVVLGGRERT
ncbi:MAG: methyltransferase, partial [Acidimicrobiales bacterium]